MGTLRVQKIFNNSMFTLFAVESVDVRHCEANTIYRVYGRMEPVAVIVCSREGTYALDMQAKPVDIDQLRQDISGLEWLAHV